MVGTVKDGSDNSVFMFIFYGVVGIKVKMEEMIVFFMFFLMVWLVKMEEIGFDPSLDESSFQKSSEYLLGQLENLCGQMYVCVCVSVCLRD